MEMNAGGGKLVLVVDDDEPIQEFMKIVIEREGFQTMIASNGAVGLEIAKAYKPDLIITDIMMPQMDGYQMIRKLQEDGETRTIPVMIISSKQMDQSTKDMLKMEPNVKDFVEKPVKPSALSAQIHAHLG